MSTITIIEGNSNDKDNTRAYMVKGEKGVSPTVTTTKVGDTATVTVTDGDGEHTFTLTDGVSPVVSTDKVGDTATITITDAEGTHTFTLSDGNTYEIPAGSVIGFDGNTIPNGYEEVGSMIGTKTVTEANQDLNDYIEEGRYYFYGNTPTNSPSGVGWLDVYTNSSENTIKQIYYRSSSINGKNEFMTFVRQNTNGTWSDWARYQMVETEDFINSVTFGENAVTGNCKFLKIGTMVFINYQGESKTHNQGDLLFTIPTGYEPLSGNVPTIFIKNANAFGTVQLYKTNRQCQVGAISDTTATGRIYFSMFYNIA